MVVPRSAVGTSVLCHKQTPYIRRAFLLGFPASYPKGLITGKPVQFDAHCIYCGQSSTFKDQRARGSGAGLHPPEDKSYLDNRVFGMTFTCQRNTSHQYSYFFEVKRQALQKIGQSPSLADIASSDIAQYGPVLDKNYFRELKTAIGLFAHGVGIGSFTYLRRIFDKLIADEHKAAVVDGEVFTNWKDTDRLEDKISALKGRLPPALMKHKSAYGVLSAGIHELDEETCLKYFPVVKAVIIAILEDHLAAKRRKKAEVELERAMKNAKQAVASVQGRNTPSKAKP
jgi:hypothetical protein